MKRTAEKKKLTADQIAEKAMRGEDISEHFTNWVRGEVLKPRSRSGFKIFHRAQDLPPKPGGIKTQGKIV